MNRLGNSYLKSLFVSVVQSPAISLRSRGFECQNSAQSDSSGMILLSKVDVELHNAHPNAERGWDVQRN